VSPDKSDRDLVEKRFDYAEAGIPEYWIVNPLDQSVTILVLDGDTYTAHGPYARGQQATSRFIPTLTIDIAALFDAR
jgi:Uma2 family endonuclease